MHYFIIQVLRLSLPSLAKTGVGQLTNILSNDVKRFETSLGIGIAHALWAGPILVIIVFSVLWIKFGWTAVTGFIALGLILPVFGTLVLLFLRQPYQKTLLC
jgi:ABC-type multidrug transport system fused ATPase/permease subunit